MDLDIGPLIRLKVLAKKWPLESKGSYLFITEHT